MKPLDVKEENAWLALMIGNSRLHWALFAGARLLDAWDTDHLAKSATKKFRLGKKLKQQDKGEGIPRRPDAQTIFHREFMSTNSRSPIPLVVASVVPEQTGIWEKYPNLYVVNLEEVPLQGMYSTLGIDRALGVLGAGEVWGSPVLVIDAGTALTFTGANEQRQLVGGAILPGLKLQLESLAQGTAGLPPIKLSITLPPRWALNTASAIQSGIVYTVLAGVCNFIEAWWQEFPDSPVVLTGGDRATVLTYLQSLYPKVAAKVITDPHVVFWGMRSLFISSIEQ